MKSSKMIIFSLLRISLGFIFSWSFLDKVFGLNFSTSPEKSWLQGVSPTSGFLKFGTEGIFSAFFQELAGVSLVDWLFMIGLCSIGTCLMLGIGIRIATIAGSILMVLMWLSMFPPQQNPFVDEHIIYILVLLTILHLNGEKQIGLGNWWKNTTLVKKYSILE